MKYISDKATYCAIMFAKKMIKDGIPGNIAVSRAARYYDVDTLEVSRGLNSRKTPGKKRAPIRFVPYWIETQCSNNPTPNVTEIGVLRRSSVNTARSYLSDKTLAFTRHNDTGSDWSPYQTSFTSDMAFDTEIEAEDWLRKALEKRKEEIKQL